LAAFTKESGELAMYVQAGQQLYLSKAKEAEQEATRARNPESRASWLRIAENYRDLARYTRP
jgi:hypothetical protein